MFVFLDRVVLGLPDRALWLCLRVGFSDWRKLMSVEERRKKVRSQR